VLLSCHQNAGQSRDKVSKQIPWYVAQFKCLGMTIANQNVIKEEEFK
jgi:hypothetical protein